jgi:CSLREA domain-containing protein
MDSGSIGEDAMKSLPVRLRYPFFMLAIGAILASCGGKGPAPTPAPASTLTVNSANDVDDGVCNASHCSLREAINKANILPGTVTIRFDIGGGGVQTIRPESILHDIFASVLIDGTTQPGYAGSPLIELDGSLAGVADGLIIRGDNSTVRGLVINRYSRDGIRVRAEHAVIKGNYIGTDVTGTVPMGNGANGVDVCCEFTNPPRAVIGGLMPEDRNIISANGTSGISLDQLYSIVTHEGRNVIQGNYIGTDVTGMVALGNQGDGILIEESGLNSIGGTATGAGNVISANQANGVGIAGEYADENLVSGNFIGTDYTGMSALGNQTNGVLVNGDQNTIGGLTGADGNVISANLLSGVFINSGTKNNVQGNRIGVDVTGTAPLGNHGAGVAIYAALTLVGGTTTHARNIISDNWLDGVRVEAGAVLVKGNYIGTDITGTAALGNHRNGVFVSATGSIDIGGGETGAMNVISGNLLVGVSLEAGSNDVAVYGNRIGTNAAGTAALGNIKSGVYVGGTNIEIGASFEGAQNLISGNGGSGIAIGDTANEVVIKNNFIGTDATGMNALGNDIGIEVGHWTGAASLKIGGANIAPNEGNLISGNHEEGILLYFGAKVWGNKIGTDVTGTGALGNGGNGILVKGSGNQIGGVNSGNTIAFNDKHGVAVISESHTAARNAIQVNSIHDNGMLGIALDGDAILTNDSQDADTGDNGRQNFPFLASALADTIAGTTTLIGHLVSKPNTTYSVELFANVSCDPSGYGEGQMMFDNKFITTDAQGNATISQTYPTTTFYPGNFFTATATDPDGNTSEFSNCIPMTEAATPTAAPTSGGMQFKPSVYPGEFFYGDCTPDRTDIGVEVINPPEEISYLLLFVRLVDQKTGAATAWSEGLTMSNLGKNKFFFTLMATKIPDYDKFENAWLQYQFVAYNKAKKKIGASDVYGDVAFRKCGRVGTTPTKTPAGTVK